MKNNLSKFIFILFLYLYACSIFFPRGLTLTTSSLSIFFSQLYKALLYFSIIFSLLYTVITILLKKLHVSWDTLFILQYYIYIAISTVVLSDGISSGLQSIFYPIFIYAFFNEFQDKEMISYFFKVILNLMVFLLSINLFDIIFKISNIYHVTFLGHVQVTAQFGVIGFLIASYYLIQRDAYFWRANLLLWISILNCALADVSLSKFIAIFMILYTTFSGIRVFFAKNGRMLNILIFIVSVSIFYLILSGTMLKYINLFDFTLNGRYQLWKIVYQGFLDERFFGYGVFGFHFNLPWNVPGTEGINYAHNQFLQIGIDSGLIGILSFISMIFYLIYLTKKIRNDSARGLILFSYACLFWIMIVESVSYYPYYFIVPMFQILYTRLEGRDYDS